MIARTTPEGRREAMMYMTDERWDILEALSDGRPIARQDVLARMGVDRMPGYPFTKLIAGGLIERPARATYIITAEGQLAMERHGYSVVVKNVCQR